MRILTALIVFLVTVPALAQTGVVSVGPAQFSSTPAEGFMRGQGHMINAYGEYLRNLGVYENLHQDAYAKFLENNSTRIQYRINSRNYYREYLKEKYKRRPTPDHFDRSVNASFVFFGQRFSTIEEWKNSSEYRMLQDMHKMDDASDALKADVDKMMGEYYDDILRRYNKHRGWYDVYAKDRQRRDNVKKLMGWETLPPVTVKRDPPPEKKAKR